MAALGPGRALLCLVCCWLPAGGRRGRIAGTDSRGSCTGELRRSGRQEGLPSSQVPASGLASSRLLLLREGACKPARWPASLEKLWGFGLAEACLCPEPPRSRPRSKPYFGL